MRWVSTKSAGERCFLYAKADWDARVVVMSACDEAKIDPLSVWMDNWPEGNVQFDL